MTYLMNRILRLTNSITLLKTYEIKTDSFIDAIFSVTNNQYYIIILLLALLLFGAALSFCLLRRATREPIRFSKSMTQEDKDEYNTINDTIASVFDIYNLIVILQSDLESYIGEDRFFDKEEELIFVQKYIDTAPQKLSNLRNVIEKLAPDGQVDINNFRKNYQSVLSEFYDLLDDYRNARKSLDRNEVNNEYYTSPANIEKLKEEIRDWRQKYGELKEACGCDDSIFARIDELEAQLQYYRIENANLRATPKPSAKAFNFFKGCETDADAEKRYKNLIKAYHPDSTWGDNETSREINAQYQSWKKGAKK